jgi:hypothetical protein
MVARAFEEWMGYAERCAMVREASWSQASPVADEVFERMSRSANPIVRSHGDTLTVAAHSGRTLRTRLRILRIAATYRATQRILELEDPFGGRLRSQDSDSGLRIWSVGRDGVDDGGVGTWKPSDKQHKDIVLELPR